MTNIYGYKETGKSIVVVALIVLSSIYLTSTPLFKTVGINGLAVALIIGMSYRQLCRPNITASQAMVLQFASRKLLRAAIVLYGFHLTLQQILSIGWLGFSITLFIVISTVCLGTWIGRKVFRLDFETALLISAGSGICGAAAVLATESTLGSSANKAVIALMTVVLFGTLAMFLEPLLYRFGILHLNIAQFALFAGSTIHEVGQLLVVGNSISEEAMNIAIVTKMMRVLWLLPFLIILGIFIKKRLNSKAVKQKIPFPWFIVGFATVIIINSLVAIPMELITIIQHMDNILLIIAMAALGVETNFTGVKKLGLQPFGLATILFGWLWVSAYSILKVCS